MKHCFTPTQRKVFNHVVEAGARQVLKGALRTGNDTGSVSEARALLQKRLPGRRQMRAQVPVPHGAVGERQPAAERGRRAEGSCCAFGEFVTCKYLHVSQDCGHDAALFLQQHLDRISSPLIHEHCAHYTYASDACAPASPASSPTPMLHLHRCSSLIFLIMWILLHWVTCLLTPPRIIT
ncbi:uncharacterized protein CEXT_540201 [Caerostris extrusa]|uniref:Uncharacterized protein n=1 Tax=Caerostris extrusa TaxID=172846 RepID=A0AAV4VFP0_CAEEX|nr:uncharacterized protein CEXT_540201 [Caerostris extrusa]